MTQDNTLAQLGKRWLRWALMAVSAAGIVIFSFMLASTFAARAVLEKAAIFAVQEKVQAEVRTKYPKLETEGFRQNADILREKFGQKGDAIQAALDAKMDEAVAIAISRYCGCETVSPKRQNLITDFFKNQNAEAVAISAKLGDFIKGRYDSRFQALSGIFASFPE